MRAGQLRHLIQVDEPVTSQSDTGEEVVDWTQRFIVRGEITPLIGTKAGREVLQADQILANADTMIRVRWSPETSRITPKWRLRYEGIIFNVQSVAPLDYRRQEIQIVATSGLNQG